VHSPLGRADSGLKRDALAVFNQQHRLLFEVGSIRIANRFELGLIVFGALDDDQEQFRGFTDECAVRPTPLSLRIEDRQSIGKSRRHLGIDELRPVRITYEAAAGNIPSKDELRACHALEPGRAEAVKARAACKK
jgi:hypothetical protein